MTRIAILSDIHGNLPAFEAVQRDIAQLAPDRVIVDGDILNRGPQSLACLHAVRATGWPVIFGNHEEYALKRRGPDVPEEWMTPFYAPFQDVADALSSEEAAYLRALPHRMVIEIPGLPALHITHGSPFALNDGLGHWLSDAEVLERAQAVPQPVLIGAHTHRPFDRHIGDHWVLNTSAVGVPFNGDPRAQYLLLHGANGAWSAELRTVPYDRTPVYDAYESSGGLRYVINHVFKLEVETATFHFASYVRYCNERGLDTNSAASFERYRAAAARIKPGRSLKPSPPHPNGAHHPIHYEDMPEQDA